jgi:hypothetical protein
VDNNVSGLFAYDFLETGVYPGPVIDNGSLKAPDIGMGVGN